MPTDAHQLWWPHGVRNVEDQVHVVPPEGEVERRERPADGTRGLLDRLSTPGPAFPQDTLHHSKT